LFDYAQPKQLEFCGMKWILNHIRRLIAAYLQKPAPGYEPITPADPHQTDLVPSFEPRRSSERIKTSSDSKRKELGVDDALKNIPGVTTRMLVAFGEHGIKSIEDLADCATDDLNGWSESKDGKTIRHAGILDGFRVSRKKCEAIIINARIKAGWIK
jgi:hypothetical protein